MPKMFVSISILTILDLKYSEMFKSWVQFYVLKFNSNVFF